jgi:hypothetical protein
MDLWKTGFVDYSTFLLITKQIDATQRPTMGNACLRRWWQTRKIKM